MAAFYSHDQVAFDGHVQGGSGGIRKHLVVGIGSTVAGGSAAFKIYPPDVSKVCGGSARKHLVVGIGSTVVDVSVVFESSIPDVFESSGTGALEITTQCFGPAAVEDGCRALLEEVGGVGRSAVVGIGSTVVDVSAAFENSIPDVFESGGTGALEITTQCSGPATVEEGCTALLEEVGGVGRSAALVGDGHVQGGSGGTLKRLVVGIQSLSSRCQ